MEKTPKTSPCNDSYKGIFLTYNFPGFLHKIQASVRLALDTTRFISMLFRRERLLDPSRPEPELTASEAPREDMERVLVLDVLGLLSISPPGRDRAECILEILRLGEAVGPGPGEDGEAGAGEDGRGEVLLWGIDIESLL